MPAVSVFCSSSGHVSPIFLSEMELLSTSLAQAGHTLVCGGEKTGVMGHMIDCALKHGGRVVGVIPEYLYRDDVVHSGLSELIIVKSLRERKWEINRRGEVLLVFPGGLGTLDEVTEVLSLKTAGEMDKPLVFHNFLDFWQPWFEFLTLLQHQGMIRHTLDQLYTVLDSHEEVLNYLNKHL